MSTINFQQLTNHLANVLKDTARATQNLISETILQKKQERIAQQQAYRQAVTHQAGLDSMYQIQAEIANILRQTHITNRLSFINHVGDFLPCNYKIINNTLRFYFLWTKTNPNDCFDSFALDNLVHNMNLAIINYVNRYIVIFQRLNDYEKREFYCQHPSFNFGFKVLNIKDKQDSIVIEMELGFPE